MPPKIGKKRKGVNFSTEVIVSLLLIVIFAAIVLSFFLETAQGVENAGSCTSPIMQAIANQIADITGRSIVC